MLQTEEAKDSHPNLHQWKDGLHRSKSEGQAKRAIRAVVRSLKSKGIPVLSTPKVYIQNIVASVELGGKIDLERLVYSLKRTIYEPEQFPEQYTGWMTPILSS